MRFKITETVSMFAAGIACIGAVVSALIPALYAYTSRSRELDIKLVEIGIGILRTDPKETQTEGAREWAIEIIERHSGKPFSSSAKQELLQYKLGYAGYTDYSKMGYGYDCTYTPGGTVTCIHTPPGGSTPPPNPTPQR